MRLVGVRVARFDDADLVIREGHVSAGKLDFGHMTTHAVCFGYGTRFGLGGRRGSLS